VIGLTAIKQGYEDLVRHKDDRKINRKLFKVLKNNKFDLVKSKDIRVKLDEFKHFFEKLFSKFQIKCGEIVAVSKDQVFPCDMILLHSTTDNGTCHMKTANLDGETNLKQRTVPKSLPKLSDEEDLVSVRGLISCEKPNLSLTDFSGSLTLNEKI
jgi:phospholipid-translocating ATPase